ncbi:hypothetical protein C8J57DRAFT_1450891 [Mycena rebaudengoi]|nr:hypothetical protein C8J57DRAFT_1450891 [Mycena rebaudengoi]
MCFLDILDNLSRLRLSSSQLRMILWIMQECGAKDVPSFNAFRSMQAHIRKMTGVRSEPHKSDLGNLFYVNDVRDLIAKDFANPEVAPHIQKCPEDVAGGPISEIWQIKDGRWHDIPLDELAPSILIGHKRYYIHEIAELSDGQWVIPALWINCRGKTYADCYLVGTNVRLSPGLLERTQISSVDAKLLRVRLDQFILNHEDILRRLRSPHTDFIIIAAFQEYAAKIPNRFRQIDNGDDLFTVWIPVWADDVSGARSKQYQKHINVYTANANLPGRLLQQEYFVRFVSTSPHAAALEQLKVVVNQVKSTHENPVRTYDADSGRPCSFRLNVPDGPADNPQQAEEASHIGHQGSHFCRRCMVGGTNEEKECPDGYHSFYEASLSRRERSMMLIYLLQAGKPRNVDDIRTCVLEQLRRASYGVASHVEELQTATGTKDKIAPYWIVILIQKARSMQTENPGRSLDVISNELLVWLSTQTDQPYNPLLDLPFFDPSQDTLVEILHTILLGDAKYTWYELHHNWTEVQQNIFTVRLQSTNLDGLSVPPIRAASMMQYRNVLIGKHFKTLMQTMIFHVHDIVTPDQFTLVQALGELGPILWMPVIDDMDQYLADLQILIDNLLDAFANLDPTKILIKLKLHVLLHIIQDIRRRGPAVRFSTEVFECFNAIFRLCSVLSNHQAPSRDIAAKLADLDRVKHILSGGYWLQEGAWVRAGKDVHRILRNTPIIQRHLGWAPPPVWTPGLIQSVSQKKQKNMTALTFEETLAGATNPCALNIDPTTTWTNSVDVTAQSGDRIKVDSWALVRINDVPVMGRVKMILLPKGSKSSQGLLVFDKYNIGEALHPHLHMPVLLTDTQSGRMVVPSDALQFSFNAQHDCRACGCDASGVTRQMQERQESDTLIRSIVHKNDTRYVINTHAFHNAGLLRKILPVALTKPRPLFADRRKLSAAATREKNKLAKAARAAHAGTETQGYVEGGEGEDNGRPQKRPYIELNTT